MQPTAAPVPYAAGAVLCVLLCPPVGAQGQPHAQAGARRAPRIWADHALKDWAIPVTGVNARPRFYSEAEYLGGNGNATRIQSQTR